jgi:serine/threonine protein kinase/Tfp pilus assembly protein PilF
MSTSNWQQVESIFHEALVLDGRRRSEYLDQACSGIAPLRREVESLLKAYESRSQFMEDPAFETGLRFLHQKEVKSLEGETIGPYKVLETLGKGGMGEVYLAEDTRLGRKVALKFLSPELVGDSWAKRQLIKEAQAAAMLDHPNICAVYGIEEIDGHSFIVMQFVEGETLAALIAARRIDPSQVLPLAKQIVSALAESHAHSIIHRDIKPKNIMVTPGGQVKVLDFGLAKTIQERKNLEATLDSVSHLSQAGLVQGTVAYMSPEQLRAEKLDYRTDIFSFGTVLYELLSGERPFARGSEAETISAILTADPRPLSQNGHSHDLSGIVLKCLHKDKNQRYQSFSEILYELGNLQQGVRSRPHSVNLYWIVAASIVVFVLAALVYVLNQRPQTYRLAILPISNKSGNANVDYLEAGLPSSLIAKLSALSELKVPSFTTVANLSSDSVDPFQTGNDLGVDALLLGTILSNGNGEVLQVRLVDPKNRRDVWSEEYPLASAKTLELRGQLADKIASTFKLELSAAEKKLLEKGETNSDEAFQEYWRGKHFWRMRNQQNIQKAIKHFETAIEKDPAFAQAYAGLSECYAVLNTTAYGNMPTDQAIDRARYLADTALAMDYNLPDAHVALGVINLKYVWNWEESEKQFKIALSQDPEDASAYYWYSQLLTALRRFPEAMELAARAKKFDPISSGVQINYCRSFYYSRQFTEAANCLLEILKEKPSDIGAKHVLGFVYIELDQMEEAKKYFDQVPGTTKALKLVSMGYLAGRAGRRTEALQHLAELERMSKSEYVPPFEFAVINLGLGNKKEIFFWLNKAYEERFAMLVFLAAEPGYDSIRSDRRFKDLAQRMNLPYQ